MSPMPWLNMMILFNLTFITIMIFMSFTFFNAVTIPKIEVSNPPKNFKW